MVSVRPSFGFLSRIVYVYKSFELYTNSENWMMGKLAENSTMWVPPVVSCFTILQSHLTIVTIVRSTINCSYCSYSPLLSYLTRAPHSIVDGKNNVFRLNMFPSTHPSPNQIIYFSWIYHIDISSLVNVYIYIYIYIYMYIHIYIYINGDVAVDDREPPDARWADGLPLFAGLASSLLWVGDSRAKGTRRWPHSVDNLNYLHMIIHTYMCI